MTAHAASVSIDLDPLRCYGAIHALSGAPAPAPGDDPIYRHAIPRYRALLDALGVRATFFVVARDLADPAFAAAVSTLSADGHEIASHSLDHPYDLVRLPPESMAEQVEGAAAAIASVLGQRPRGFRAPGYTMSDALVAAVAASGATYDSSVFPCPSYLAAKAFVVGALRLAGRHSASIVGSPSVLAAPVEPYRMGRRYTERGDGLLEIPIGVTPGARWPLIGTAVTLLGPRGARRLAAAMRPRRFAGLELHGIDLCDAGDIGSPRLARRQIDLAVSLARKQKAVRALLAQLAADGRQFLRLEQVTE